MNEFAERLRLALKQAGYTQKRATEELNLSKNAITNYMNGRIPDATILYRLSKLLNVTMEWLLEGDGQPISMVSNDCVSVKENCIDIEHIRASDSQEVSSDGIPNNLIELTEDERDLINKYRQISINDKEEISALLNMKYSRVGFKKGKSFTSANGENGEDAATKELA